MTTQAARDAFDEWAAGVVDGFDDGAFPDDPRIAMLAAALRSQPDRDRRSVWMAFSAGWVSAMTHVRDFCEDEGALGPSGDEDD